MLLYAIRLFVFAAVYVGATLWWASRVAGFGGLGIIGGGVILAGGAAAAWLAAVIIGRQVPNAGVRFVVHVLSTVIIFLALSLMVMLFLGFNLSHEDNFIQAFTGIVALGAAADSAIGLWREQARAQSHD